MVQSNEFSHNKEELLSVFFSSGNNVESGWLLEKGGEVIL